MENLVQSSDALHVCFPPPTIEMKVGKENRFTDDHLHKGRLCHPGDAKVERKNMRVGNGRKSFFHYLNLELHEP